MVLPNKAWKGHSGPVLDTVAAFDVIDCESCGFKHVVPIPTAEELERVYREEYYSVDKPLYLTGTREELDWWDLVHCDRFDTFEAHLPAARRRILDIGSGPGFFLKHGESRGWKGIGIEPSKQAAAHSRDMGLEIVEDFFDEATAAKLGKFDVVHLSEVLEHVTSPTELLKRAYDVLNPGGLICVVVPNDYNPFQHVLRVANGFKPWWVAPPHHINYFDFDSLAALTAKLGFEVVLREATFPIDLFLVMGDNYVGNDQLGKACHAKRKTFERNLAAAGKTDLRRELYRRLAEVGLGREVCLYARRTS